MRKTFLIALSMICALYSWSQTTTVTGRVTDQRNGQPLAGVTVTGKGTNVSVSTEPDGSFRISVPASVTTLVFTSVGFEALEQAITGGEINVQLALGQSSLSEVIVTGYTTANKRQVAGSVTKLVADEVSLQPIGSFDKALQGKIPGLLSQSQTGQPGAGAVVVIRGKGSINGTNTPLYIIDGIQVNAADFASLNTGDIESFTVLKDASSTAIYGSRGANGVIVVTTKRGSQGQTRINYDLQMGYSELPKNRLELMNSEEKLRYEFYDRPFFGPNWWQWTDEEVDSLGKVNHDIEAQLFHKGITQQHQLSASGGNERTRFYISGSIFDQEGIVRTTGLKRYTGRANIENTFGDFKIGLNATFGYSRRVGTLENGTYVGEPLNAIRWFNPYLPLVDEEGNYQDDFLQNQPNPLRELLENSNHADQFKGVGSIYAEWNIPWIRGLKARTLWGADFTSDETRAYFDRSTDQGSQTVGGEGQLDRAYAKTFRYTGTTSLNYVRNWGDHELSVGLFNEMVETKADGFGFSGFGLVGPFKNEAGITPGTPENGYIPTVNGNITNSSLLSYFADVVYGYKGKYYINAGARRDGSSRLSRDDRWANFGHVGVSWIMSDERFLQNSEWLDMLKFKASYGSVGSQGVGDYATRELLSATSYNGTGGLVLTNFPRQLTWERKVMFNTGFEFSLFSGLLNGTLEYYNNTTQDLFLDRQLSRTSGAQSITNNLGKLRNSGIEVAVTANIIRSSNFSWSIDANYSWNKNELLDQNGLEKNITGIFINQVGQPINSLYMVRYAGVDPDNGDALYYELDGKTTTNVYDPEHRVILGTTDPPHYGGFGTTVNYKGLQLEVLFSYAFGNVIYNNDRTNVENPIYWFSNLAKRMLNEWQQPGDITDIPSSFNNWVGETSRYVEKGDYLRLRNVMLSYSLPRSVMQKLKLRSIRVFAQGQNLKVWHNFLGYDPEITTGNLLGSHYPQLRTVTFGLNVGL